MPENRNKNRYINIAACEYLTTELMTALCLFTLKPFPCMWLDFRVHWNPFSDHLERRAARVLEEHSRILTLGRLLEKGRSLVLGWST